MEKIEIRNGREPGEYRIDSFFDKESIAVTAQGLTEIYDWCLLHMKQLEREAKEEREQDTRAWEADMKDMQQIKREWEAYRLEGDETPPIKGFYRNQFE